MNYEMERKILFCNNISVNVLWTGEWEEIQNAPSNILSKQVQLLLLETRNYQHTESLPFFCICHC